MIHNRHHQVFISYAHEDKAIMQKVRSFLQKAGLKVWTDEEILPGTPYWDRDIEEAVAAVNCMVVILTPNAKTSDGVRTEINLARSNHIPIFPVVALGDPNEYRFYHLAGTQQVDIRINYAEGINRLVKSISRMLDGISENSLVSNADSLQAIVTQEFGSNWTGIFFSNTNLTGTGETISINSALNFSWGYQPPSVNRVSVPSITTNHFSVRFIGTHDIAVAGVYTFTVTSASGVRVAINGAVVLDRYVSRACTTDTFDLKLNSGPALMNIEYFNDGQDATLSFFWNLVRK
ncbi:MAG TPA: TIR domain-containing protein [Aggregatilineales bacterium]|nr:TIR domain-containing protein [Aggregatilineales bacterium]